MTLLNALQASAADLGMSARSACWRKSVRAELSVAARAAVRTAPWLWRARLGAVSFVSLLDDNARTAPDGLAVEMGDERYTWRQLAGASVRIAAGLMARGVAPGDVVALFAHGSPAYIAGVMGIARAGAVAALINPHLSAQPLEHALQAAGAKLVVTADTLDELVRSADRCDLQPIRATSSQQDFVYIYTSGTTGLPKPCRVSHLRALTAAASFGPLVLELEPGDKLYCVLPLYHASGLLIAFGSCLFTKTPMAMRAHFSASGFWDDVRRYRATAWVYIGELCRYLVNMPPRPDDRDHTLRMIAGNGLRADVWRRFQQRFGVERVREYYGATEAPGALINFSGKVGSVGRLPLRRLGPLVLARFDSQRGEHVRNERGHLIACRPGEVGELLYRLPSRSMTALSEFRGYADKRDNQAKILRDAFRAGDRYYRSGDLLRHDSDGFFYFVDRIGDTFRFKGENVSTSEVADVLGAAPGVSELAVVGVEVPGIEGRAGLAAVVCHNGFDADGFAAASQQLPWYARPRFVRVMKRLPSTATHKIRKVRLARDGIDPARVADPMYLLAGGRYVTLTDARYNDVATGAIRI